MYKNIELISQAMRQNWQPYASLFQTKNKGPLFPGENMINLKIEIEG
jgi:hypothetical protein